MEGPRPLSYSIVTEPFGFVYIIIALVLFVKWALRFPQVPTAGFGRGDVPRATRARPEYVRLRFLPCPTCMNSAALRTRSVGQGNYAGHTHLPAYEKRRGSYRAFFAPSADNNVAALQFLTNQTKPRLILFNHVYRFKRVAKAPLSSGAA